MRSLKQIQEILFKTSQIDLSDIKKVYLLGSTGAGKTSLVRNIIDTVDFAFPPTTQTRTTVAPTEYVIKNGHNYKTTILLKEKEEVEASIELLVDEAIQRAIDNYQINKSDLKEIIEKLEESPDEKFRLKYMVTGEIFEQKAYEIQNKIIPIFQKSNVDIEQFFELIDVKNHKLSIIQDLMIELEETFNQLSIPNYKLFSNEPLYIEHINNKADFIKRNRELLKNEFGSLSLLVEYTRIEGDLFASWLKETFNELVIIDGEGIGHSLREKNLSIRHYDFFDYCNQILLVEKGEDPFISGGRNAIENIFLNGYKTKFKLAFSKIDKIENNDRNAFLRRRLSNLKDALLEEKIIFDIENKDTYKFDKLNEKNIVDYSKAEIKRLLNDIDHLTKPEFQVLEYDFNSLFTTLDNQKFITNFRREIDKEHHMTIKAFTKRMYNSETEFNYIKPVSKLLLFIMKEINIFLQRDDQYNSDIASSQNQIKQEFSRRLIKFIYQGLIQEQKHLWQQAYEEHGIGSNKRRKGFIFRNILQSFLPFQDNIEEFQRFKNDIKLLLLQSGAKELADATKIILTKIEIQKIYKKKNFNWEIGTDGINILIGKNGAGKSTILKLVHACINSNRSLFEKYNSPYIMLSFTKHYKDNSKNPNIVMTTTKTEKDIHSVLIDTFDVDGSLNRILKELIKKFDNYRDNIRVSFKKETEELTNEINKIMKDITSATPEELISFQQLSGERNQKKEAFYKEIELFREILNDFYNDTSKEIIVDDGLINNPKVPLLIKFKKDEINEKVDENEEWNNLCNLSSGEKQLLIIFLSILIEGKKPFILLMDEPETSLHVEWQSKLIENIKKLNSNIQVIIATHNPLIMLNREPQEIGVVEIDNENVQIEGRGTKYLDVSMTLIDYFGLNVLVGKEMQDKVEKFFLLKDKRDNEFENFSSADQQELDSLENELNSTMASRFIYDRAYFKFLAFVKENEKIDFTGLKKLNTQEFNLLLEKYKAQF